MAISCFIKFAGQEVGFWIQPRCPLAKLKSNTLEQLGLEITGLVHVSRPAQTRRDVDLLDDGKFLIEDIGVKAGDCLELRTKAVQKGTGIANAVHLTIALRYQMSPGAKIELPEELRGLSVVVDARRNSPVQQIIELFRRGHDFVPDTVKLLLDDVPLSTTRTVDECKLGPDSKLVAQGMWFPLSLLPGCEHMQNVGVRAAEQCCICLTAVPSRTFECGHLNVCATCVWPHASCPICKQ